MIFSIYELLFLTKEVWPDGLARDECIVRVFIGVSSFKFGSLACQARARVINTLPKVGNTGLFSPSIPSLTCSHLLCALMSFKDADDDFAPEPIDISHFVMTLQPICDQALAR